MDSANRNKEVGLSQKPPNGFISLSNRLWLACRSLGGGRSKQDALLLVDEGNGVEEMGLIKEAMRHFNRGNLLLKAGDAEGAVDAYNTAVRHNPAYTEAFYNLGFALHDIGRFDDAAASYRRALEIKPDFADAHGNLGNTLKALGQLDEAESSYRRALQIKPDFADAHNNLGVFLQDTGRFNDAAASYRLALQIRPDFAEAHFNLGNTLKALGQLDEAEPSYRRALETRPDIAEAHYHLGEILRIQGRTTESEASLRRALEIQPDSADTLNNLGVTLTLSGRISEAGNCYKRALEIQPDHAGTLVSIGYAASDEGRFTEAEAFFRRALSISPKMPSALTAIPSIRKMTLDDAAWLAAAEETIQSGIHPVEESDLRFAMGKYYDDIKEFDRAFHNYRRANELSKAITRKHDRQIQSLFFDNLIRNHDRERMRRVQGGASGSTRPVFIVGMPRSGTTLIEQIIASHPAAFGAGELRFWSEASAKLIREEAPDGAKISRLAEEYLRVLSDFSADAMRIVDKAPGNFLYLGLIHTVFPNARVIHTRRNPLDACLSIYFNNYADAYGFTNDLTDLAHYYREYYRLMAHWRATLSPEVFLEVPYEGLVENQESWSRKIVEFIGLDWNERCLDFHKTERRVMTASQWQVRQQMYKTSIGRWRNYEKFIGPLTELMELRQ